MGEKAARANILVAARARRVARHEIIGIAVDRLYTHEVQGYVRQKSEPHVRDVSLPRREIRFSLA